MQKKYPAPLYPEQDTFIAHLQLFKLINIVLIGIFINEPVVDRFKNNFDIK